MAVATKQYNSFLGGLVGESCQYRTDMERFGKWFSTADNVRFNDLGSFGNRPGFMKVATTKNNRTGEDIRLLSFSFNDENSYLIEVSTECLRFFKNGTLVKNQDGTPYELKNELNLKIGKDLKYAQAADVIYICDGTQCIKELRRIKDDEFGFEWEFKDFEFKFGAMPLDYENDDENKTISIARSDGRENETFRTHTAFIKHKDGFPYFERVSLSVQFDGDEEAEKVVFDNGGSFYSLVELAQYITNTNGVGITATATTETKSITFTSERDCISLQFSVYSTRNSSDEGKVILTKSSQSAKYLSGRVPTRVYFCSEIAEVFGVESILVPVSTGVRINGSYDGTSTPFVEWLNGQTDRITNSSWYVENRSQEMVFVKRGTTYSYPVFVDAVQLQYFEDKRDAVEFQLYLATTNFDFWSDKEPGDVFGIRHRVPGKSYVINAGNGNYEHILYETDGSWGLITSGGWSGSVTLLYSLDNGTTWIEFFRTGSGDKDAPQNVNVTGKIDGDGVYGVAIKIVVHTDTHSTDASPSFTLKTDPYEALSYYKLYNISTYTGNYATGARVRALKDHIGYITDSTNWREGVFSNAKGWPTAIGFYQSRLFISKDWTLYGSKTNDFYDFYEPIELADDDPITMSLLSYKVNTIQNISLLKGFFVFTGGGEFNIVSEGALTQKDKNLQQFSNHGSAPCLPVVVGNHIMFVDKSKRTIRAMRYVFGSDTYEAEDVSILLEDNISNERIKTIEYMSITHEVLFLSESGVIFVFKFLPEQNIACWSKWSHSFGKITNICVVPNGPEEDLYICVETVDGKQIEVLSRDIYKDSCFSYVGDAVTVLQTNFIPGIKVHVDAKIGNTIRSFYANIDEERKVQLNEEYDNVVIGIPYKTEATLLGPEIIVDQMGGNTVYNRKRPFKAHFIYRKSKGFKVGVKEGEKMEIQWQDVTTSIDDENKLTSGKKSVLIPCRYDGTSRVSFVQEEPFRFEILNAGVEVDYGGK